VNVWRFEGAKIRTQHARVLIPFTEQPGPLTDLTARFYERASLPPVAGWRTSVRLHNVSKDRVVSAAKLDDLDALIRTKLGLGMRRKGTTVQVVIIDAGKVEARTINPHAFTGERLPIVTIQDPKAGAVRFEIFKTRRVDGNRTGEVLVMNADDLYPIRWKGEFDAQAQGTGWLTAPMKEAFAALDSGFFEGVITAGRITLGEDRTTFFADDSLEALYGVINKWYRDHGRTYFEDEREARREERYLGLGERSLDYLRRLFQTDLDLAQLAAFLPDEKNARSAQVRRDAKPKQTDVKTTPRRRAIAGERKPREPKDSNRGFSFRFAYEALASSRLWEFEPDTGILTFNIRHPTWVMLDETNGQHTARHDRQVMHLQEWVALKVLLVLAESREPGFNFEIARLPVDAEVPVYARMFIQPRK